PEHHMSRPWLREMSVDGAGRVRWQPPANGFGSRLAEFSSLHQQKSLLQENLLSLSPARDPALRPKATVTETDAEIQSLVQLAQLKNRLKNLDLHSNAPQAAALCRLLTDLSAGGQRHVVFYAKESPDLLQDVMDLDEHARRYEQLVRLVRDAQGPS